VATGFDYDTTREWKRQGLPLIKGRIKLSDAEAWLKTTFLKSTIPSANSVKVERFSTFRLKYL
jgi:hypothetical protein